MQPGFAIDVVEIVGSDDLAGSAQYPDFFRGLIAELFLGPVDVIFLDIVAKGLPKNNCFTGVVG
jgi:hypothetical protein